MDPNDQPMCTAIWSSSLISHDFPWEGDSGEDQSGPQHSRDRISREGPFLSQAGGCGKEPGMIY